MLITSTHGILETTEKVPTMATRLNGKLKEPMDVTVLGIFFRFKKYTIPVITWDYEGWYLLRKENSKDYIKLE